MLTAEGRQFFFALGGYDQRLFAFQMKTTAMTQVKKNAQTISQFIKI